MDAATRERFEEFYAVVRRIPRGQVATYGQVAELAGYPGRARQVGRALGLLPPGSDVPWFRILNAAGVISLPRGDGFERQRDALRAEGIDVTDEGRVRLRHIRFLPGSE